MTRRGTPARAVLAGGISRHGAHCDCRICTEERRRVEAQRAISAQRDVARAEVCSCGHTRGDHQGECASCHHRCGCFSFSPDRSAA